MTDNTHDPPAGTPPTDRLLGDDEVLIARPVRNRLAVEQLTAERAHLTASLGYRLLARALTEQLGPTEPLELVRDMANGRYRWRRRDGFLMLDEHGQPLPDRMSFRAIATELERLTGEVVTYETLRRWWGRVWEGTSIPDGPARQAAEDAGARLRERVRVPADTARVGAARAEAADRQSNADVPPAAFLPPAD